MSEVRLIPLGVGDAFSALNYTTCLALGVDDDWLLIDCPHPIRKMLREAIDRGGPPVRPRPGRRRRAHPPPRRPLLGPGRLRLLLPLRARPTRPGPGPSEGLGAALGRAARRRHGADPRPAGRAADLQDARRLLRPRPPERVGRGPLRAVLGRVPADHPHAPHDGLPHPRRRPDGRLQRRHGVRPHADRLALRRRPDRPRGDVGPARTRPSTPPTRSWRPSPKPSAPGSAWSTTPTTSTSPPAPSSRSARASSTSYRGSSRVMPLRDHFRPPLSDRRSWEGIYGGWPAMIVSGLDRRLSRRYAAEPRVHLGSSIEIDVATLEDEAELRRRPGLTEAVAGLAVRPAVVWITRGRRRRHRDERLLRSGFPRRSPSDQEAVKRISRRGRQRPGRRVAGTSEIACSFVPGPDDLERRRHQVRA